MKHIVCYSGGVSSSLVGAMVVKKFGKENTIWLNHEVKAEPEDVARYEQEFAKAHGMEITYANGDTTKYPNLTPYDVIKKEKAFAVRHGAGESVLCTHRLKTDPFNKWLEENYENGDVIYYGFDKGETARIQRRSTILASQGYKSDYPLALWENPLDRTYLEEIGVAPPMQYKVFKHANCRGCIKGGIQHWLCVYVHDRETFDEFAELEEEIGHSILRKGYLNEMRGYFEKIRKSGVEITEHKQAQTFWAEVRRKLKGQKTLTDFFEGARMATKPCECLI